MHPITVLVFREFNDKVKVFFYAFVTFLALSEIVLHAFIHYFSSSSYYYFTLKYNLQPHSLIVNKSTSSEKTFRFQNKSQ